MFRQKNSTEKFDRKIQAEVLSNVSSTEKNQKVFVAGNVTAGILVVQTSPIVSLTQHKYIDSRQIIIRLYDA